MVEGCAVCVKYVLFLFNLVIFILGLVLLGLGIAAHVSYGDYTNFADGYNYLNAATLFIVVGVFLVFIVFFGCCGAIKENRCMLLTFFIILFIILVCEIVGGALAYKYNGELNTGLHDAMDETMKEYNVSQDMTNSWDAIQHELKCCGTDDSRDWGKLGKVIPDSCCEDEYIGCVKQNEAIFKQGCFEVLKADLGKSLLVIGGVGIGIIVIQVMNMIFACCLYRSINDEGRLA